MPAPLRIAPLRQLQRQAVCGTGRQLDREFQEPQQVSTPAERPLPLQPAGMLGEHQEPAVAGRRQPGRLMVAAGPNRFADRQPARLQRDHRGPCGRSFEVQPGLAVNQGVADQPRRIFGGNESLGRGGRGRAGSGTAASTSRSNSALSMGT